MRIQLLRRICKAFPNDGSSTSCIEIGANTSGDSPTSVPLKPGELTPATVKGCPFRKMRVPTPLFSATLPVYAAALKSGHANDDTAAVCAVLEAKARIKRRKSR